MKRLLTILTALMLFSTLSTAQTVYYDASILPLYGKATDATGSRYERLPASYESISRDAVWWLGRQSAGLFLRFRSNSTSIHARWTSTFGTHMDHMPETGSRGLDLYTLTDKGWKHIGTGRPATDKTTDAVLVGNMDAADREYMLYLSLYDGVSALEIGVDEGSYLEQPAVNTLKSDKPVVMYGTSILQGGCASRPGMAHTNIIARRLGREVINLGFSGNALLDLEIAELMASVENPAIYVLDYAPNAWDYLIREKGEQFFRILRDAHPDVPVIFIEDVHFSHYGYDNFITNEVDKKNQALRELFDKLKKQGEKKIWYLTAKGLSLPDGEGSVDGTHYTDLGMVGYADYVTPVIRKHMLK